MSKVGHLCVSCDSSKELPLLPYVSVTCLKGLALWHWLLAKLAPSLLNLSLERKGTGLANELSQTVSPLKHITVTQGGGRSMPVVRVLEHHRRALALGPCNGE